MFDNCLDIGGLFPFRDMGLYCTSCSSLVITYVKEFTTIIIISYLRAINQICSHSKDHRFQPVFIHA